MGAAVREASSNLQLEHPNWFCNYWILFDIAWAAEAALIQICVDFAKKQKGMKVDSPTPDDIDNLRATQAGVWDAILDSPAAVGSESQSIVRDSITMAVLAHCSKEDWECFAALGAQPARRVSFSQLT